VKLKLQWGLITRKICVMPASRASLHAFMVDASDAVIQAACAMGDSVGNRVNVHVCADRRGWEIHCNLAEEDEHLREVMLNAAKAKLQTANQSLQHACLLHHRTNPWKDVRCGFRSLFGYLGDEREACMSTYGFGFCPNGVKCPLNHPCCVKRLYVVVRTGCASAQFDASDSVCDSEYSNASSGSIAGSTGGSSVHSHNESSSSDVAYMGHPPGLPAPPLGLPAPQHLARKSCTISL